MIATPFTFLVLHVVRMRAKKKMIGVDALRNVALMKDVLPFWNWTVGLLPEKTVCTQNYAVDFE